MYIYSGDNGNGLYIVHKRCSAEPDTFLWLYNVEIWKNNGNSHEYFNKTLRKKSNSPFLIDGRILSMIIRVHLHVTSADVSLVALILDTVVMGLFPIVLTVAKLNSAVIGWRETQKAMIQGFRPFFVPLQMSDNFFFFVENLIGTLDVVAVIVFSLILDLTLLAVTVQIRLILGQIFWVFSWK